MKEDKTYSPPLPSEETAKKYIKAMDRMRKVISDSGESIENMLNSMLDTERVALMLSVAIWKVKLNTSYFFTRWYYKRKLNQAESKLKSFNQIKL